MLDIKIIRKTLPQRYPFLLVDRVLNIELGSHIRCLKNVTGNEDFFSGHFPDNPVMPGVLILEGMAQASGVLGFQTMNKTPESGSIYLFVGADEVRFKKQVVPGDQLIFQSEIVKVRAGIWKFSCVAEVENNIVATAVILCADRPV